MILHAAIDFFALHGFSASTRDLARGMGISVSLIHRYFATKEALIAAVYDAVYSSRYDKAWLEILQDGSVALRDRLLRFYSAYLAAVDDEKWVRIALYSGLSGTGLGKRYLESYVSQFIEAIATQLRRERGSKTSGLVSEAEVARAWVLHSALMYFLIRKHVHGLPGSTELTIEVAVDTFLAGALAA